MGLFSEDYDQSPISTIIVNRVLSEFTQLDCKKDKDFSNLLIF